MSLDFLRSHGGRRLRAYPDQPLLIPREGDEADDEADDETVELSYEQESAAWQPIAIHDTPPRADSAAAAPRRFVDGCHLGHTVAWLQDGQGHPIPVMLSEIGGVCMRLAERGRTLTREFAVVERVVTMIIDPFPWDQIESFAAALQGEGLRLLPAAPPRVGGSGRAARGLSYDFEAMRRQVQNRSNYEMEVCEELSLCNDLDAPTLVDGRLESRLKRKDLHEKPIVGVIKQQCRGYLHRRGWQVYYQLPPGSRTPAFLLRAGPRQSEADQRKLEVITWYLRLDGARGALPNWGVVRVELPRACFEGPLGRDFRYLDWLSRHICALRCTRASYPRGPVSLEPIVRAEESLKSLFSDPHWLTQRFYRLTGL